MSDIVRAAGDTYPSKTVIKIGGVPVDLRGWHVDLRFKKDNEEWVINCMITDQRAGKVSIYPHARRRVDITDPEVILNPSEYKMTGEDGANQVWDEVDAGAHYPFYIVRWKTFDDGYTEEMTHTTGHVILTGRYPV